MSRGIALTVLNDVAAAMFDACANHLLSFEVTDFKREKHAKRPTQYDIQGIEVFQQMWGSTALGFGGIGGAAMTTCNVIIITGPMGDRCVYFGSGFAYHIQRPNRQFADDVTSKRVSDVRSAKKKYEDEEKPVANES